MTKPTITTVASSSTETVQTQGPGPDEIDASTTPREHLLDLDDLAVGEISELLDSAKGMLEITGRDVRKTPALRGKTIITMFFENSTRTRVSFEQAGKILGADVINVTVSASSVSKGESLLNTVKTLQRRLGGTYSCNSSSHGSPVALATTSSMSSTSPLGFSSGFSRNSSKELKNSSRARP